MKAVITAAGYASRLWPLTKDTPKPLLEVKGRPIVEHIILKVVELPAVDEVVIVTNSKFYARFHDWLKSAEFPLKVKLLSDGTSSNEERLGQVGDVNFVLEQEGIDDDLLVIAGDNLFNFSLLPAFQLFRQANSIVNPLYDSKSLRAASEQGSVVLHDDTNVFAEFMEKSASPNSTLISLGIYFFPKDRLNIIRQYLNEGNSPDKMGFFMTWLMRREKILGHVYTDKWFDVGWIESLETARKEFNPEIKK